MEEKNWDLKLLSDSEYRHSMGQSSLWLLGGCSRCPGKCSFGNCKGQRRWKSSFSGTWTWTLLQSIPSGCNCKSEEGGKGKEEGISVHFWKSYKFLTLIHCDILCFVLSETPLLWGKSFHVSWILLKAFPMPALFIHVYEVCLYLCFSKCHHKNNIIKYWKKSFPKPVAKLLVTVMELIIQLVCSVCRKQWMCLHTLLAEKLSQTFGVLLLFVLSII